MAPLVGITLIGCGIGFGMVPMIIGGIVLMGAGTLVQFFGGLRGYTPSSIVRLPPRILM
jgi:hypothetical protein